MIPTGLKPDTRKLVARAEAAGWRVERTGSGHLRLRHPKSARVVIMAATPSDHRAVLNARARLKRELPAQEPKPRRIAIHVPMPLHADLEREAEAAGVTVPELCRQLIEQRAPQPREGLAGGARARSYGREGGR